ncbi:MAG: haloacid dehalogenase-like hydrolase [Holophagales bacterium]|nr:haloacid dehalogenase-like hydrolase [Holophagales bacterium]
MTVQSLARNRFAAILLGVALLSSCASSGRDSSGEHARALVGDPLESWRDSAAKRAITSYVNKITRPGSPGFIPPEHRLATFDFDGTIGCEKPGYMEVMVAMKRLCERTAEDPDLLDDSLYRASCDGDLEAIDRQVEKVLAKAFEGEPQSFFAAYVESFLRTARHPRFDRPYGELYYAPMLELIEYLHANQFVVYLVSGSQQGFTRAYGQSVLGIPAERAIGHAVELDFSLVDGAPVFLRRGSFLAPPVDGKGKAEILRNRIGRQPVLAFGNSMGDFEMLQFATSSEYPSLGLILVHDDPDEYVYRDQELLEHAETLGWQIVSMKGSFERIFPHAVPELAH